MLALKKGQKEFYMATYSPFTFCRIILFFMLLRISGSNTILWGDLFVSLNSARSSGRKGCYGCVAG